ncbi:synaptonemal complex protein 1-like [Physella acuta]|uniref:synaptonemal complex protein 1-like n=1 Tax=Physella acuta TaxID=109671 RepID=UPI0027DE55B2|nr:synaptonemal complex protein 1-like [Physella acuta]
MSSPDQVKHLTELMKYLEEQIRVMEPVIEVMKNAVEKSRTWVDDENDNQSVTYTELCQELESATTAVLDVASHIISKNKCNSRVEAGLTSQSTPQTTATEKCDNIELKNQINQQVQHTAEILSRLELIETALSSLQDTKQKTEDDISEIKQWKDTFVSERENTTLKTEQFFRRETENIESLREEMSEQDNKVKELNKEFESLKEKETKSNKALEKLALDMKEYENNLLKINKELQDHTDKTDSITQEVRIHCSIISTLQDTDCKREDIFAKIDKKMQDVLNFEAQIQDVLKLEIKVNNVLKFEQKVKDLLKLEQKVHDIMNFELKMNEILKLEEKIMDILKLEEKIMDILKLEEKIMDILKLEEKIMDILKLEEKIMDILKLEEKIMDILKLEEKVKHILKLEEKFMDILKLEEKVVDVLKLSPVVHAIESRVCNRYLCHIQLAHSTPVGRGSIIATFSEVREYYGNCFNQTTGKFVAPQDGLYLLCLTLQQWADKQIRVGIYVGEKWSQTVQVKYAGTSASGSVVVVIKKGQSIYLHVDFADPGAKLSSLSSFTIVSL